jgi:hypothetical protein
MRLRQLVSDDEFQAEREALNRRHQELERAASVDFTTDAGQNARKAEVATMLDLVHGAPLALAHGDPVQLRSILQRLQLEITLQGRRLDVSVSEPLSHLVEAGSVSNWCATWSDIWKWIQFGEAQHEGSVTDYREAA